MKLKVYKSLLDVKMIMGLPYKIFVALVLLTGIIFLIFKHWIIFVPATVIYILCAVMSVKDPMTLELIIEHYKTERYLNP
ncbi:type IV secretory pathway, VirB3 component [Leptotrichia trevisanii]|uniref:Type IV secretory pathway, VirB3 component n=1 Tax=Leptotrichia trevisanii TaxID=109328 RepID=A0A510KHX6_9FUSO|nr:VirB3 family type IV secretion system protein [Leptotrichia trevisanii]BBM44141.1 type IV secretory pathway, VirB3 component [Leptotrichia trevisanii]BBM51288.1 type IV secretory pathway, VirB3 component [Leptotrichia trevisanii]